VIIFLKFQATSHHELFDASFEIFETASFNDL